MAYVHHFPLILCPFSPKFFVLPSEGSIYEAYLSADQENSVQRPYVLETITVALFIIRNLGLALRRFPQISLDVVGLVDEWAACFFKELDYINEGENETYFAEMMKKDLPHFSSSIFLSNLSSDSADLVREKRRIQICTKILRGFNCGEAANFETSKWISVAKEAVVSRAAINFLPMLSHQELLYPLTMSFIPRWLELDLKLVVDIGIVGAPNVGKRMFLSVISVDM
ncbi:unnamed protein product [Lactuca saligna]|uniref:ABC1 atypical kinase-like domain-containing protein n=1 Tax=Lactuca saligna TaxID=75948 RepID=A0AA35VRD8_LACSI|nr:unnamed protein product [Lactuca saligna]